MGQIILNTVYNMYMYEHAETFQHVLYMSYVGMQPAYITFIAFYIYFEYVG